MMIGEENDNKKERKHLLSRSHSVVLSEMFFLSVLMKHDNDSN